MIEDLSDVIAELASGTYTVQRSGPPSRVGGRVFPSIYGAQAWRAAFGYAALGEQVESGGNVYALITAGVSDAVRGPTGTGSNITDGTAHWKYAGPAATQLQIEASVQPMGGRELDRLPELLRQREVRVVFTGTELKGTADTQEADQLTLDGEQWQVQTVESWSTLGGYYRAIVARMGR